MASETKRRVEVVFDEVWAKQSFRNGDVIDAKFVKELVEHVYRTAVCDCMVMLEDCSGYNLRELVKQ